jgi:hypothetical protein
MRHLACSWARARSVVVRAVGTVLLVGSIGLSGCLGEVTTLEDVESANEAITNGAIDTGHSSVGMVRTATGPNAVKVCTGTLVGSRTVLTAAHCVTFVSATGSLVARPATAVVFRLGTTSFAASSVWFDPSFAQVPFSLATSSDLALVSRTSAPPVTPTPVSIASYATGTTATLVGFGITSTTASDGGTKRKAQNVIGTVLPAYNVFHGTGGSIGNACSGDSGGPTLVTVNGIERVAGVISHGLTSICGELEAAARTSGDFGLRLHAAAGRDLVVDAWRNPRNPIDVNNDGLITSADVFAVTSYVRSGAPELLPPINKTGNFVDANGDGRCDSHDVFLVVAAVRAAG